MGEKPRLPSRRRYLHKMARGCQSRATGISSIVLKQYALSLPRWLLHFYPIFPGRATGITGRRLFARQSPAFAAVYDGFWPAFGWPAAPPGRGRRATPGLRRGPRAPIRSIAKATALSIMRPPRAPVAELVDATDSKSVPGNRVGVRVPPGAPMFSRTYSIPPRPWQRCRAARLSMR